MRQYNRVADIPGFRIRPPALLPLDGSSWRDHFSFCVSSVCSRTACGKADSSLVRRVSGGLVGVLGFLSNSVAARLSVCDCPDALSKADSSSLYSCRFTFNIVSFPSHWTGSKLGNGGRRRTGMAYSRNVGGHGVHSVFPAFSDESAAATLAGALGAPCAISFVCTLEFGFFVRSAWLSADC